MSDSTRFRYVRYSIHLLKHLLCPALLMNAWTVSISLSGPDPISAADPDHLPPINFQHFFCPSRHSWDSSVGATEKLSRLRRTERTVMKAGTGWKRTTEACRTGVPEEPMRIEIGSGRIQWHGVSQHSCPTGTRPFSLPYVEEKIILHIFGDLTFFS